MATEKKQHSESDQATNRADEKEKVAGTPDLADSVEATASHASAIRDAVSVQIDGLVESAGNQLKGWGEKLQQDPQGSMMGTASQMMGRGVAVSGEYLADRKISGMKDELASVVKANPLVSILIASAIGWFVFMMLSALKSSTHSAE